jgi:hypothetical protein
MLLLRRFSTRCQFREAVLSRTLGGFVPYQTLRQSCQLGRGSKEEKWGAAVIQLQRIYGFFEREGLSLLLLPLACARCLSLKPFNSFTVSLRLLGGWLVSRVARHLSQTLAFALWALKSSP